MTGNKSGTGVYCHTVADTKYESEGQSLICSATDGTAAGELGAGLASFEGRETFAATAEATNLNGTGNDMKAWLLDTTGNLAATRAAAEGGQKLINQGATIWDEDGGVGAYSIGVGSGPFMVIITPLNY